VTETKPLILISNDDGINAPGIQALTQVAEEFGDTYVVAPSVEKSAQSHAITVQIPLRIEEIAPKRFAVEGTPADCVMVACQKLLPRKPDWTLSGINRGGNLGDDVIYSGTVGAAIEARLNGCRAMAISLEGTSPLLYETAARVVRVLMKHEKMIELGDKGVLNVNIPSRPFEELRGIAFTSLGKRIYDQFLRESLDPRGRPYYWIGGGGSSCVDLPGSDCNMIREGYVTISVIRPDMYDREATSRLKELLPGNILSTEIKK
jgi:5'-nucleotidase